MEKYSFVKCLKAVKPKSLNTASVTIDHHVQVAKYKRTQEPDIVHYFHGWHISKRITVKGQKYD